MDETHIHVETAGAPPRPLTLAGLAVLAAAYPWLLDLAVALARASDAQPPLVTGLAAVFGIAAAMSIVAFAIMLCRRVSDPWTRALCCLAATTPTLYVGTMNYTYLFGVFPVLRVVWVTLWVVMGALGLAMSRRPAPQPPRANRKLATAHGFGAAGVLILFLGPHLANHLTGLWSAEGHIAFMHAVRLVYRNDVIEPALLGLVAFQVVTGLMLVAPRLTVRAPWFALLQGMSGVYTGLFFLGHIVPVFSARAEGTDTDWNWLTGHDAGLIANLPRLYLVPHYWVGVIAVTTHLVCGLRDVFLKHRAPPATVDRVTAAGIGAGALASTLILLGLLAVHIG